LLITGSSLTVGSGSSLFSIIQPNNTYSIVQYSGLINDTTSAYSELNGGSSSNPGVYVLGAGSAVGRFDFKIGVNNTVQFLNDSSVNILGTLDSTSPTSGALKITGGVGIAKNLYIGEKLIVGTGNPIQNSMLSLYGLFNSTSIGPHIIVTTNFDIYPLYQQNHFNHNDIEMNFDCYRNGNDLLSSLSTSNFQIKKSADSLKFNYYTGTNSGSIIINIETALSISNIGIVNIGKTTQSTSTTTGALTVAGGVGIAKNLIVDGTSTFATIPAANIGVLNVKNFTPRDGTTTGVSNVLSLSSEGTDSLKWGSTLEVHIGTYEANVLSRSRADFKMINNDGVIPDTTVMTMNANGRIGIGSTNPQYTLDVVGDIRSSSNLISTNNINHNVEIGMGDSGDAVYPNQMFIKLGGDNLVQSWTVDAGQNTFVMNVVNLQQNLVTLTVGTYTTTALFIAHLISVLNAINFASAGVLWGVTYSYGYFTFSHNNVNGLSLDFSLTGGSNIATLLGFALNSINGAVSTQQTGALINTPFNIGGNLNVGSTLTLKTNTTFLRINSDKTTTSNYIQSGIGLTSDSYAPLYFTSIFNNRRFMSILDTNVVINHTTRVGDTVNPTTRDGGALNVGGDIVVGADKNLVFAQDTISGPPTFTNRSVGTRIVVYPSISGSGTDYAIGIEGNTMWQSIGQSSASHFFKWYGGTTGLMSLTGVGTLTCIDDIFSFGSVSDARLKKNIVNISSGIDTILALRAVTFDWKNDIFNEKYGGKSDSGFIAQEVEKVLPHAVSEYTEINTKKVYKSMRHERIIPYLVSAIQELHAEILLLKKSSL
jgi:hypothetical protein